MEAGRRPMLHETPRGVGGYLAVFTGQQTVHAIEGASSAFAEGCARCCARSVVNYRR
jgi:hypothetical protein